MARGLRSDRQVRFFLSAIADAKAAVFHRLEALKPITVLTALGIVYGDIGTSPLYVYQAIGKINGGHFDAESALGSLSLIIWTLLIVVALKYAVVVMRADNRGEGGILALTSLTRVSWRGRKRYLIAFGLIGAALLYGDGMITPAISVLSAVEGLKNASGDFAPYAMPIAAIVLLALFLVQRFGTAAVGSAFGPLMLVWFAFIAVLGVIGIGKAPHVLVAVNPYYAAAFLLHHATSSSRHSRRRVPLRDGRRGHVCRYGPYRPQPHSHRLGRGRVAGAPSQLFRSDRSAPEQFRRQR